MNKETLLIMPAYNEDMNIGSVLKSIQESDLYSELDILVVNDGSKDRTVEVAKECGVHIINHLYNLGYGAALQSGYKYASDNEYKYVLQMDADGQHDIKNLEVILKRLKGETPATGIKADGINPEERIPDIIIGSRFLEGSQSFKISGLKAFAINCFCKAITLSTGYHLTDPTSGLQGMNRKAFTHFARFTNFDTQYPDLNMVIQMILRGFYIEEIPAIMHERTAGVSMHTGLLHAANYMLVMTVSTFIIFNQNAKRNKTSK